jgi:hypothetical protein
MNELQIIRRNIYMYKFPENETTFYKAERFLEKIHSKYGTVDISTIENIIK